MLPFIHIGRFTFALYGLWIACGGIAAYYLTVANARRNRIAADLNKLTVSLLTIIVWGAIASKLYFALDAPKHFIRHPMELFRPSGFTFYGAALGVIAILPLLARFNGMSTLRFMDLVAPGVTVAYGLGRLGCFFSGDGDYGIPTTLPWGMTFPNGLVPTLIPVHPTPLYELATSIIIAAYLWRRGSAHRSGSTLPPGAVIAQCLIWTAVARFAVEFIKRNPVVTAGLGNAQLVALVSATAGMILWYRLRRLPRCG